MAQAELAMQSRKDLLQVIRDQQKELEKYQSKIRDVVTAYKSLQKEKESLAASLTALKVAKGAGSSSKTPNELSPFPHATSSSESSSSSQQVLDPPDVTKVEGRSYEGSAQHSQHHGSDVDELVQQVETLSDALSTITSEKSRMEASYQADRRKIFEEKNELQQQLHESQQKLAEKVDLMEALHVRVRDLQRERDKEEVQHALQIRELQQLVSNLRLKVEKTEEELNEKNEQLQQKQNQDFKGETRKESELIKGLRKELASLKEELRASRDKVPPVQERRPSLIAIEDFQRQHEHYLEKERQHCQEVEVKAEAVQKENQERIASLEASLADLSTTLGQYEVLRQQDLDVIQKLKSEREEYEDEIRRLREEVHRTRIRVRSPLPQRQNSGTSDASLEMEKLRTQISEYREKILVLNKQFHDMEEEYKSTINFLQETLQEDKQKHRKELKALEHEYKVKLCDIEKEIESQRNRTLSLLTEKDGEIEDLRQKWEAARYGVPLEGSNYPQGLETSEPKGETMLLFYTQELARKDVELSALRREKHEDQIALRQLQQKLLNKEDIHQEREACLEEEIDRLQRSISREGENLEYLKNVIVNYLRTPNPSDRQHMLNAICAVLKFTDKEVDIVRKHLRSPTDQSIPFRSIEATKLMCRYQKEPFLQEGLGTSVVSGEEK
ncbi:unnamed protein product [Darwinula stevensoni]|uniref:GRIP domain-containing protein n=1 Tax=Darwinula stevensoni TaxID=69355 RepID=A0A7R8X2J2_9CRUS|nr:unnamed protein product [Darwinula stevensoni]CAG0883438.1 unnamed protein product [Darwinula stevensoni]